MRSFKKQSAREQIEASLLSNLNFGRFDPETNVNAAAKCFVKDHSSILITFSHFKANILSSTTHDCCESYSIFATCASLKISSHTLKFACMALWFIFQRHRKPLHPFCCGGIQMRKLKREFPFIVAYWNRPKLKFQRRKAFFYSRAVGIQKLI